MIRPGRNVNSPATTSAPKKIEVIAFLWAADIVPAARAKTASTSMTRREDRQQMDRAERAHQADLMDPERADRDRNHQQHPDPADCPVRQRALGRRELHDAEREGGHRREGVKRIAGRHPAAARGMRALVSSASTENEHQLNCQTFIAVVQKYHSNVPQGSHRTCIRTESSSSMSLRRVRRRAATCPRRVARSRGTRPPARDTAATVPPEPKSPPPDRRTEAAATAAATAVEHGQGRVEALQHDFGRVLLVAALVGPFAGLQRALDVNLGALLQILLGDLAEPLR